MGSFVKHHVPIKRRTGNELIGSVIGAAPSTSGTVKSSETLKQRVRNQQEGLRCSGIVASTGVIVSNSDRVDRIRPTQPLSKNEEYKAVYAG